MFLERKLNFKLTKLIETTCFDDHYHAFKVKMHPERVVKVLHINDLFYFKAFDLQMKYVMTHTSSYVAPYCHRFNVFACAGHVHGCKCFLEKKILINDMTVI